MVRTVDEGEFWQLLFGTNEKFEDEKELEKYLLLEILDDYEKEDNKEKIDNIKTNLIKLIDESTVEDEKE